MLAATSSPPPTQQLNSQPPKQQIATCPDTKEQQIVEPVEYSTVTRKDPALDLGKSRVEQEGVNGERTILYKIALVDCKETDRVEIPTLLQRIRSTK